MTSPGAKPTAPEAFPPVELRNTLSAALGRPLPATLLFDYPTLEALTGHVLATVGGESAQAAPASSPSLFGAIEDLSDDEVERQLAARAARKGTR